MCTGLGTILNFRYPLEVLERIPLWIMGDDSMFKAVFCLPYECYLNQFSQQS